MTCDPKIISLSKSIILGPLWPVSVLLQVRTFRVTDPQKHLKELGASFRASAWAAATSWCFSAVKPPPGSTVWSLSQSPASVMRLGFDSLFPK